MPERNVTPLRFPLKPGLIVVVLLAVVAIVIGATSFFVVDQTETAVLVTFGRYSKTLGPGLHFKVPFGIQRNFNVKTEIVQVDTAQDGATAWAALNANAYDLIITDHTMPRLTGLDLIRRVHAFRPDLPCILISGNMPTEEIELIPPHLPFRAIEKPVRLDALVTAARTLMAAYPIKPAEACVA